MSKWSKTTHVLVLAVAFAIFLDLWASHARAEEQRCAELGASCVCSEPMNTTTFAGGPDFWNPADSTTKQCSVEAASTGGAIVRTSKTITSSADATALSRLPSGHSVSRFVRAEDNHLGTFSVGNGTPVTSSLVRLAARWYIWHTPTFDFKLEGSCDNSKITVHEHAVVIDYTGGFHTYGYQNFKPSSDCCVSGPGPHSGLPTSEMKGKWWRFEVILTNRSGPNFDMKMYAKNVTDNGPELTLIDLASNSQTNRMTPPSLMSAIVSNNHRYSASGQCRGWIGISHYMMAGWTTNAGQRIGAAREIESGGGGGTIPPPTNLKVSELFEELRSSKVTSGPRLPPSLRSERTTLARSGWTGLFQSPR
jgi:hypothetical protein